MEKISNTLDFRISEIINVFSNDKYIKKSLENLFHNNYQDIISNIIIDSKNLESESNKIIQYSSNAKGIFLSKKIRFGVKGLEILIRKSGFDVIWRNISYIIFLSNSNNPSFLKSLSKMYLRLGINKNEKWLHTTKNNFMRGCIEYYCINRKIGQIIISGTLNSNSNEAGKILFAKYYNSILVNEKNIDGGSAAYQAEIRVALNHINHSTIDDHYFKIVNRNCSHFVNDIRFLKKICIIFKSFCIETNDERLSASGSFPLRYIYQYFSDDKSAAISSLIQDIDSLHGEIYQKRINLLIAMGNKTKLPSEKCRIRVAKLVDNFTKGDQSSESLKTFFEYILNENLIFLSDIGPHILSRILVECMPNIHELQLFIQAPDVTKFLKNYREKYRSINNFSIYIIEKNSSGKLKISSRFIVDKLFKNGENNIIYINCEEELVDKFLYYINLFSESSINIIHFSKKIKNETDHKHLIFHCLSSPNYFTRDDDIKISDVSMKIHEKLIKFLSEEISIINKSTFSQYIYSKLNVIMHFTHAVEDLFSKTNSKSIVLTCGPGDYDMHISAISMFSMEKKIEIAFNISSQCLSSPLLSNNSAPLNPSKWLHQNVVENFYNNTVNRSNLISEIQNEIDFGELQKIVVYSSNISSSYWSAFEPLLNSKLSEDNIFLVSDKDVYKTLKEHGKSTHIIPGFRFSATKYLCNSDSVINLYLKFVDIVENDTEQFPIKRYKLVEIDSKDFDTTRNFYANIAYTVWVDYLKNNYRPWRVIADRYSAQSIYEDVFRDMNIKSMLFYPGTSGPALVLTDAMRSLGVKTLTYVANTIAPHRRSISFLEQDGAFLYGNQALDSYLSCGFDNKIFNVVGNPRFDRIFSLMENKSVKNNDFRRKILIATSRVDPNEDVWINYLIEKFWKREDIEIIVRPHPSYNESDYDLYHEDGVIFNFGDTFELLSECDILLTDFSTVGVAAAVIGLPMVVVNLTGSAFPSNRYDEWDVAKLVTTLDRIEKIVESEMARGTKPPPEYFVSAYNMYNDGRAADRILGQSQ